MLFYFILSLNFLFAQTPSPTGQPNPNIKTNPNLQNTNSNSGSPEDNKRPSQGSSPPRRNQNNYQLSAPSGDGKTTYNKVQQVNIESEEVVIDDKFKSKKRIRIMYAILRVEYYKDREKKNAEFKFRLYHNRVPETVQNFVDLAEGNMEFQDTVTDKKVKRPFYNGLTFHRLAKGFIMQTGDPKGDGSGGGPGFNIPLEINKSLVHDRFGVVSMARIGNESHGSQFFITLAPAPHLDGTNTVFGQVVDRDSVEVLEEIGKTKTDRSEKPKTPIIIKSIKIQRIY